MKSACKIQLIIPADEPALFYRSIGEAVSDLEAIDVRDGTYSVAYGPSGELHQISEVDDLVYVERRTEEPDQPERLAALLVSFLRAVGLQAAATDGLEALLARCEPYLD